MLKLGAAALVVAMAAGLAAVRPNDVPALERRAAAAWGEMLSFDRQRGEEAGAILPALRAAAPLERELLDRIADARRQVAAAAADAGTMRRPERFQAYVDAQAALSAALARLATTLERYPEIRADAAFMGRLARLERAEDRAAVARRDYADAAAAFNRKLEAIPDRWLVALFHPGAQPLALGTRAADPAAGRS